MKSGTSKRYVGILTIESFFFFCTYNIDQLTHTYINVCSFTSVTLNNNHFQKKKKNPTSAEGKTPDNKYRTLFFF